MDKNLTGAMETALVEGLQQKYVVFSGEQVSQKAREIFLKETRNTAHKECDETKCMQNIAMAFQAELLATANVTKQDGIYYLALSIQNIFDNKVEYSKSLTCENCNGAKVIEKLKTLSGVIVSGAPDTVEDEAQKESVRKQRAEQLKKEQQAFEDKLRKADAAERKRLLDAKAADDKRLVELKAAAEARRKNNQAQPTTFPLLEQAQPEITKLNDKIAAIEAGYEKELADTRKQVTQRYSDKLNALNKEQRDEFNSASSFKTKQEKMRIDLIGQRDAELARLNVSTVAETETAPLKARIKALTEHDYIFGADDIEAELGSYDADEKQFNIKLRSKNSTLKLKLNGTIPLQGAEAKVYKQQWQSGLVRPEAKTKLNGNLVELTLVNDADNSRLINFAGRFLYRYVSQGGLIWMPISFEKNWADANAYCNNTAIKDQIGWRLPTKDELIALYLSSSWMITGQGWTLSDTWSSTPSSDGNHLLVSLLNGSVDTVIDTYGSYVTCVR